MKLSFEQLKTLFTLLPPAQKSMAWSTDYQNRKLRDIIKHAHTHVPFYRDWFGRAQVSPKEIRTKEDLRKISPVNKEDLKHQPAEQLLAQNFSPNHLATFATSGSTGVPLVVRRSRLEDILFHLIRMQAILVYGLKRSDKFVRIRGSSNDEIPLSWRVVQKLGFYRQVMLSTFDPPEKLLQLVSQERPDVLTGYAGSLVRIAQLCLETKMEESVRPRFLVSGGDMLTPHGRHAIKEAFQAPVYDTYESQELGLMAWECPDTGNYHVCENNVILEVLKDGRPAKEGEQGEVVATGLNCYAMPFMRLKLGDMVTAGPSPCTCGNPCSTFSNLRGKMTDYFVLPSGEELNPWFIDIQVYKEAVWVEQYEVIQEREDTILLRVVLPQGKSLKELESLHVHLQEKLGDDVKLKVEAVREIEPGQSGKYFYHRSLVQGAYARTYE